MRIVFMGTPEFALPTLRRLIDSEYELVAAYTQPDRPAGRGRHLMSSPVKELALQHGLVVRQPARVSTPEATEELAAFKPDLIVVAAYGQILKERVLQVPPRGIINIHASLLPRHRGASPVAAAILAGDSETGVTIMLMELALDEGPILSQRRVAISPHDTTGSLIKRLADVGADLLMETLPGYLDGTVRPQPQDPSLATYVSVVHKEDGLIDWRLPAEDIWRRVRAYNPRPYAFTYVDGVLLRILEAWPLASDSGEPPGTVLAVTPSIAAKESDVHLEGCFAVQTGQGLLAVLMVQKEGRRALPASDFLRGERGFIERRLG